MLLVLTDILWSNFQNYLEVQSITSEADEEIKAIAPPPPPTSGVGSLVKRRKIRPLSEPIICPSEVLTFILLRCDSILRCLLKDPWCVIASYNFHLFMHLWLLTWRSEWSGGLLRSHPHTLLQYFLMLTGSRNWNLNVRFISFFLKMLWLFQWRNHSFADSLVLRTLWP